MKNKIGLAAQILLGLLYFVFGLNGFLNFIPQPPGIPEAALTFSAALVATGYFFPLVKATEVICGLLLLTGFASPVALIVLAPIMINIAFFHSFLTPGLSNQIMWIVMLVLHITAACSYWHLYRPLFNRNPKV
jgi:putative oxidoreductase